MSSQSSTPTLPLSSSCFATTKDWDVSDSVRSQWILSTRTGLAPGWFWSHGYDVQARVADNYHGLPIWLCCHCVRRKANKPKAYVLSNTRNIEGHLSKAHNIFHLDPLKAKRYASERTSNQPSLHEFAAKNNVRTSVPFIGTNTDAILVTHVFIHYVQGSWVG
jgi:hypothetical protein